MAKAKDIAAILCLLSIAWLCLTVRSAVISTEATLNRSIQQVSGDSKDLKEMVNATLFQIGDASHELAKTAREQRVYWNQASQQSAEAIKDARQVIAEARGTMASLNDFLASSTSSQKELTAAVMPVLKSLETSTTESQRTLAAATTLIQSLDKQATDPAIHDTLEQLRLTSVEVRGTSEDIHKAVNRWTKPAAWWRTMLSGGLTAGSKVAVIVK